MAVEEIIARRMSPNAEAEARTVARTVLAESIHTSGSRSRRSTTWCGRWRPCGGARSWSWSPTAFVRAHHRRPRRLRHPPHRRRGHPVGRGPVLARFSRPGGQLAGLERLEPRPGHDRGRGQFRRPRADRADRRDRDPGRDERPGGGHRRLPGRDTNDFSGGLRRILMDTETYYLFAYEPTNTRRDGAFRKLEVRLPGLRTFGSGPARATSAPTIASQVCWRARVLGAPPVAATVPETEDRLRAEMRGALTSPEPLRDLPVRLSADFVGVDAAAPQLVVSGYVDLSGVPFARTGERRLATSTWRPRSSTSPGRRWGPSRRARRTGPDGRGLRARARESGLLYQRAAAVKPGRYRVSVAVREEGGGKLGSASQWVEVPTWLRGS